MGLKLKQVDYYLILWCIYYLQGVLFPVGSMFAKIVLFALIIFSLYYFVYSLTSYSLPKVLRVLAVLIVILMGYGALFFLSGQSLFVNGVPVQSFGYLRNIIVSLVPVYAFYAYTQKGQITESRLVIWSIVFTIVCVAGFYNYNTNVLDNADTIGESTNNAGYAILSLLILLPVFHKKQWIQYAYLALITFFCIMSVKRGAILISIISIAVFLLMPTVNDKVENNKKHKIRNTFIKMALSAVFIYIGITFLDNLLSTNDYLNMRYMSALEGDMSGRESIYKTLETYLKEDATVFNLFFGGGAYKTIEVSGAAAHNDWLEFLVDNGILVTLIYLYYWVLMAKSAIRAPKNQVYSQIIILFFVNYLLRTFFSMSYSDVTLYASCALGYALAIGRINECKKKI